MLKKIFTVCAVCAGAVLVLTACSKKIEGNEKSHPTFIKAQTDADAGRYTDAAKGFQDLLARAPRSAVLHEKLATLYNDHINDYYSAIYHYQQYLKLSPKLSDEDKRTVRMYQNACRRKAAEQQIQEDPTLLEGYEKPAEVDNVTKLRLSMLEQANAHLKNAQDDYREQIRNLQAQLASAGKKVKNTATVAAAATAAAASADGAKTYTIQPNDNLGRIAAKVYGKNTAEYRKLIMDANGITNPNRISAGRELKIPGLPK